MTYRWFVADLRTGRDLIYLPGVLGESEFSTMINSPETVRCVIDFRNTAARAFNLPGRTVPGRVILGVEEDGVCLAAGPVWLRQYQNAAQKVTLTARGLWSYFDHRFVLSTLAATIDPDLFTVLDPADAQRKRRMGNPDLRVTIAGVSLGTYAKRVVQTALAHTGGNVPVVFQGDELGSWGRTFDAFEFANVGAVLRDVTKMEAGVDVRFQPRLRGAGDGIEFVLETGTAEQPLLAGGPHSWNFGSASPQASDFTVTDSAAGLAGRGWATGGRSADRVVVARAEDPTLVDLGFALFEALDSAHSSEDDPLILAEYAGELVQLGLGTSETWTFEAERHTGPRLGQYRAGDWAHLEIPKYDPNTLRGIPWIAEGGQFERRIVGIDAKHGRDAVSVTCAPTKGE